MGFLLAGREHLNRGFIGVGNTSGQHGIAQSINEWLKWYASVSNPLG